MRPAPANATAADDSAKSAGEFAPAVVRVGDLVAITHMLQEQIRFQPELDFLTHRHRVQAAQDAVGRTHASCLSARSLSGDRHVSLQAL